MWGAILMCRQKMQHLITLIAQISVVPKMAAAAQQESFHKSTVEKPNCATIFLGGASD